ncbi:MAG: hypothetical protein ACYC4K_02055 [Thiobacillus sp.]
MKTGAKLWGSGAALLLAGALSVAYADASKEQKTSYMPVDIKESFDSIKKRLAAEKPAVERRHQSLLEQRYDLSNRPAAGVKMSGGKAVQEGVRAKLPKEITWETLAQYSPEDIRQKDLFPAAFLPLPHPKQAEGGMLFPKFHIREIKKQEGRDLSRFDLDFDLPDHFLPDFPAPIFLTTRTDLGDVSQGKLVTIDNFLRVV